MCVSATGNVVLHIACTVRRIYTLYIHRAVHALRKATLPVADTHIPLHYNTFKVIQ